MNNPDALPDPHRRGLSWEPAARHYRDLTEQEKQAMQDTHD